MTKMCPKLMAARAEGLWWCSVETGTSVPEVAFYNPAMAPGVACIGSRCAWWVSGESSGRCGISPVGDWFSDPAERESKREGLAND